MGPLPQGPEEIAAVPAKGQNAALQLGNSEGGRAGLI